MGVAPGRFIPAPTYGSMRYYCIENRDHCISISGLAVEPSEGVPIECSAGIQIVDFSPELGETGVEIHLNGIVNPLYTEMLQHVEAYRKQFR